MNTKYVLYCGLNDKDSHAQEVNTLDAYKIACNIFVETTGGATITEAKGVYTHDDGTIVVETTLRCEVFGAELVQIRKAAEMLKVAFNQESVAMERVISEAEFI